jgi:hypothetical protein
VDATVHDTADGPGWHRYNGDRYGDRAKVAALPTGQEPGHLWPVLSGSGEHQPGRRGHRRPAAVHGHFASAARPDPGAERNCPTSRPHRMGPIRPSPRSASATVARPVRPLR